jgi:hypothetical protein
VYSERRTPESAAGYVLHRLGMTNENKGENAVVTTTHETST